MVGIASVGRSQRVLETCLTSPSNALCAFPATISVLDGLISLFEAWSFLTSLAVIVRHGEPRTGVSNRQPSLILNVTVKFFVPFNVVPWTYPLYTPPHTPCSECAAVRTCLYRGSRRLVAPRVPLALYG
jgi:hypothetical protein